MSLLLESVWPSDFFQQQGMAEATCVTLKALYYKYFLAACVCERVCVCLTMHKVHFGMQSFFCNAYVFNFTHLFFQTSGF